MDVDKFLKASVDLYYSAPGFFNYSVPLLVGGYIAFLWSGYGLGRLVQKSEIDGLKATNEAGKAQNDALKAQNDIGKEKAGVMEERVKLAKEQVDDAKKKIEELKAEITQLKIKVDRKAPAAEVAAAFAHADLKASNILEANNAISSILSRPKIFYGGGPAIEIVDP
jgi:hypothetical protein